MGMQKGAAKDRHSGSDVNSLLGRMTIQEDATAKINAIEAQVNNLQDRMTIHEDTMTKMNAEFNSLRGECESRMRKQEQNIAQTQRRHGVAAVVQALICLLCLVHPILIPAMTEAIRREEPTGTQPTRTQTTGAEATGVQPTGVEPTGAEPTGVEPTGATFHNLTVVTLAREPYKQSQRLIPDMLGQAVPTLGQVTYKLLTGELDLSQIPSSRGYIVIIGFDARNSILEDMDGSMGSRKRLTVVGLKERGGDVLVIYIEHDPRRNEPPPDSLYNPDLGRLTSHPVLRQLVHKQRFLSLFHWQYTNHQAEHVRNWVGRLGD